MKKLKENESIFIVYYGSVLCVLNPKMRSDVIEKW